jgi:mono/diheme cytochrome c family protein
MPSTPAFAMQAGPDSGKKAEDPLPEGKGKDITQKTCSACHGVTMFSSQRHTRDQWSSIIDNMVSKGLAASDDELNQINDYLATYLAPKQDPPPSTGDKSTTK